MVTTKTSIICCGDGGLQGSFIAGALAQIYRINPSGFAKIQHVFATSASMATFIYYLSGTGPTVGQKIWTDDIPNSQFLSFNSLKSLFGKEPVYNIDFLIDIVFKKNNPLDEKAVRNTETHFLFPILNIDTRGVELFSNKPELARSLFPTSKIRNWLDYDLYDLIRASCAIPILYDRPVKLGNYYYCDAGIVAPFLVPEISAPAAHVLYLVVRQKTVWSHDYKLILAAFIWRIRSLQRKTGLPGWVYTKIMYKPFLLGHLAQRARRTIPNLIFISANTPLASSLRNTSESALHNWQTGINHVDICNTEIKTNFFAC